MIRSLDIIFSLCGLIIALPVFIVVIPLLRFSGEGEVFYRQARIGRRGKTFPLLKFATMLKSSPSLATGDITVKDDFRILRAGKFLRKTKINELPQIWNIFRGDMSIVGPRPMTEKNFSYYTESVKQIITSVRPGLTGIGSIVFRDEENILNGMDDKVAFYKTVIAPYKGELETWYVARVSFFLYVSLIIFTAIAVIFPGVTFFRSYFKDLPKVPERLQQMIKQ